MANAVTTDSKAPAHTNDTTNNTATTSSSSPLVSEKGTTTIADTVVQKIAGLAAREVTGVYALGGGAVRAFGALRERIPGASASVGQGVSVEVGERQAAVDLQILVEYGVSIADLARAVRRNVIDAVEQMTGLEVVEVNINVSDVHIPGDDESDDRTDAGRVR
ncbi:Asp23/Gls24 family envelope stress response protein [Streptomyces paludis]|uniref:Asp23/Gls24 family envelope stress response protein n=1 Tax=Streptomyces paludis TaxID=2282738 RepID=A0A345HIX2_9ACTN|nr:Asp23/Gls24 family envelope stress response protein [Streptomyces paludis]AXG76646.1 Asp23/Gls24 family envelope stress response protein [Streptomyces paludis]